MALGINVVHNLEFAVIVLLHKLFWWQYFNTHNDKIKIQKDKSNIKYCTTFLLLAVLIKQLIPKWQLEIRYDHCKNYNNDHIFLIRGLSGLFVEYEFVCDPIAEIVINAKIHNPQITYET